MKEIIEVDGIKIEAIKEEHSIFNGSRDMAGNLNPPIATKIVYVANGKDNYYKFRLRDYPYQIGDKTFYRTEAKPPYWEFKFIEC